MIEENGNEISYVVAEEIYGAIERIGKQISLGGNSATEDMQLAQAALSLAHAISVLRQKNLN